MPALQSHILASTCTLGDIKDCLMRDRNIYGATDSSIRERLLKETEKFLQMARAAELSRKRIKTVLLVQNKFTQSN